MKPNKTKIDPVAEFPKIENLLYSLAWKFARKYPYPNEEEKKLGVYRLNWVLLREGYYVESRCVTVAGCLEIANPCMLSAW